MNVSGVTATRRAPGRVRPRSAGPRDGRTAGRSQMSPAEEPSEEVIAVSTSTVSGGRSPSPVE